MSNREPAVRPTAARTRQLPRVVALLLAVAGLAGCAPDEPAAFAPPDLGDWSGEPQVAAKIGVLRGQALAAPGSAAAIGRLGMAFHAHELHAEAVACYRRASTLAAEDSGWPYLAALATAKSDLVAAVADFDRAVALGSREPAVFISFADCLVRLGRAEEAAVQYRRAVELDPESTHARYGLAQLALAAGDVTAAVEGLEEAAALAPWHGEVHGLLAQAYRRLGRAEEAEIELLRAGAHPQTTRPRDPIVGAMEEEAVSSQAINRRGQALAEAGRFAEAEAEFRQVLAIRPGNARDFSNLGGVLAGQGRVDEAIAQYEQALAVDPDDTYALNNLGMALADRNDHDGAAARLERAVAIDPAYADALRNLGLVRARQGRHDEAIDRYRQALARNPSLAGAHTDLGASLASSGRLGEAIEQWRRALTIEPRELSALYNLSLALVHSGAHREAIGRLRQGLVSAPNSSRLAGLLAWELATAPDPVLRDGAEAERLARRVYDSYPDSPQAGDVLAATLAAQGRAEEAVPIAERAVAQAQAAGQPGLAAQIDGRLALYRRGEAYVQTDDDR